MEYLPNGYTLSLCGGAFPLSTDSMCLAHFARLPKHARVLDLGSGCGTLGLLLCSRDAHCSVTGLELEEAARIDGCNRFNAFIRVLIPIAKPGVMVCAIFSFLYAWGDLAYGMTFILDQEKRPITAGIFNFMGQYGTKWSYLTAFAVVTIIPVALIFIFMQKYIISGMTSGAVKG